MISINSKIAIRNFLARRRLLNKAGDIYKYLHFIAEGDPFKQIRKDGQAPLPKAVIYEPTMRCNLSCTMCYLKTKEIAKKGELDRDQTQHMIKNLPGRVQHYSITGGEPTTRSDLKLILQSLKRKGNNSVCLMTNGASPDRINEVLEGGLFGAVQLSMDGPEEVHNQIRNSPNSFDSLIRSLKLIKQHPEVYIYFLTVICSHNLNYLPEITRFCNEWGITNLTFELEKKYDKHCISESIKELKPLFSLTSEDFLVSESNSVFCEYSLSELQESIFLAERAAKSLNFQNQYLPYSLIRNINHYYNRTLRKNFRLQCRHLLTARIDPNGNLIPCFGIRRAFGNLLNQPLDKLWNSEEFCRYRRFILNNNLLPICETCHRAESFDPGFGRIN